MEKRAGMKEMVELQRRGQRPIANLCPLQLSAVWPYGIFRGVLLNTSENCSPGDGRRRFPPSLFGPGWPHHTNCPALLGSPCLWAKRVSTGVPWATSWVCTIYPGKEMSRDVVQASGGTVWAHLKKATQSWNERVAAALGRIGVVLRGSKWYKSCSIH